jgi:hypothetical protein
VVDPVEIQPNAATEVHVLGVDRGLGSQSDTGDGGLIEVVIHRTPKPITLVLSASHAINWHLTIDADATLAELVLQGNGDQEVVGAPIGVAVTRLETVSGCMHGWETWRQGDSCDYGSTIRQMRDSLAVTETSFQGCTTGSRFEIPHWVGNPPPCRESGVSGDPSVPREQVRFPGCEAVEAEGAFCLTIAQDGPALVGLRHGTFCPITWWDSPGSLALGAGIYWSGENLLACDESHGGLVRVSLLDGGAEYLQVPCTAIAGDGATLLLSPSTTDSVGGGSPNAVLYPTYTSLLEGDPTFIVDFDGSLGERFYSPFGRTAVKNGLLYGTDDSTRQVAIVRSTNGDARRLQLKGFTGFNYGMDVLADGSLAIVGTFSGRTLLFFDSRTGELRRKLRLDRSIVGLSCICRSSPSAPSGQP